ncbi:PDZ domain-containing protein [Sulfurovum sp.]|uniref:PDZ domain-containing protein n=1 Tax=Sulfurovum sp. TaxID=1969726 RepID=UPI0025CDE2EC|nr:PDZ domain-containing protein [Sulfurovum sp.]
MKHLFKPAAFRWIITILVLLVLIKLAWFAVEMKWLPASGVEHVEETGGKSLYYRVKLTPNEAPAPVKKAPAKTRKPAGSIKDITLLAIYNASDATVIVVEYKHKTKVLSKGDDINGFVLEGAGSNFATFSKNSKTYKVDLLKGKHNGKSVSTIQKSAAPSASFSSAKAEGEITDVGDRKIIDRALLEHYAKNMDDIYKNIGITEVKKGGDLKGFKITFVRKGSPFAKLGVKRGDVIKTINGQEINSYNAAFKMYKNIQNIENATLVIQRGKEEMELEYEIN